MNVAVGRVTRAHGVRGEVAVEPHTEVPARFEPGSVVFLEDGRSLTVAASRPHGGRMLVTFDGVADRDGAERLRGAYLFVDSGSLPDLPAGTYWPHELEGCAVLTEEGVPLGTLVEVLSGPANDVWAVERDGVRRLVPAVRDVVREVDIAERRVIVREDGVA